MRTRTMKNEWIRLITAGGLLGLAAIASTEGLVTGISKHEIGNGVQLKIAGTDLSAPRELRVMGGTAYIVEFDAKLEGKAKSLAVDYAGVSSAKAVWYHSSPPVVRVLVRMKPGDKPILASTDGGYTISVNVPGDAVAPAATKVAHTDSEHVDATDRQPVPGAVTTHTAPKAHVAVAQKVSLDFVNTDVVQILKALALQADVNIVTAPEVSGRKITVTLDKVTVKDALDFVTALAGLRYAQVQDSYVVATRDTFDQTMNQLSDRTNKQNIMRIVPVISGDAAGIKAALNHWFGPTTLQVLVDGEKSDSPEAGGANAAAAGGGAGAAGAAGAGQGAAGAAQGAAAAGQGAAATAPKPDAKSGDSAGTPYLLLIGEKQWVDKAEVVVHQLDEGVINATSMAKQAHRAQKEMDDQEQADHNKALLMSRPQQTTSTYMVHGGTALDLQRAVDRNAREAGVGIVASPAKSNVQTLILTGPVDAVNATMSMLKTLDTGAGEGTEILNYDIKYADPRSLRDDLVANVPGLIVTNPPAAAANTKLYHSGQAVNQAAQTQATSQPTGNGSAPTGAAGAGAAAGGSSTSNFGGVNLPFNEMEDSALPMRLILRGNKEQIEEGLKYLAKIDIAPKQIAIEMRVMELSKEDAMKFGIDWSILTGGAVKMINLNQSASGIGTNASPSNLVQGVLGGHSASASVTATLDAIANKNNLISRPNLLAIDGRESEIFVGDDVRYVESIVSSQTGPTIQSADIQVGVRLSVLARVGGDGNITMDLRPVVSFLKGFNTINTSTVTLNLPQTSVRVSQSTVNVESGETIAIGGLIQDQDILNIQKVPFLGDLPFLGQLFRSTSHDRTRSEIVFFLTVKEVSEADRKSAADPRPNEKLNKGELPIPNRNMWK